MSIETIQADEHRDPPPPQKDDDRRAQVEDGSASGLTGDCTEPANRHIASTSCQQTLPMPDGQARHGIADEDDSARCRTVPVRAFRPWRDAPVPFGPW